MHSPLNQAWGNRDRVRAHDHRTGAERRRAVRRKSVLERLEDAHTLLSVTNLTGVPIAAVEAAPFANQEVATFTDFNTDTTASNYLATIDWGDGHTSAGTIVEDASKVFHVSGTHTYTSPGSFAVGITVTDSTGRSLQLGTYGEANLVSSISGNAAETDANLINPWGMSFGPTTPFWVSDQGTGKATLYNALASLITQGLVVTIPSVGTPSGPTGQVFNGTTDFKIPGPGSTTVPSLFLFDTLDGTIAGWNPGSTGGPSTAVTAATVPGAVFTGLANGSAGGANYLYAADFAGDKIDVFDATFTNVTTTTFAGKFTDPGSVRASRPTIFSNSTATCSWPMPSPMEL